MPATKTKWVFVPFDRQEGQDTNKWVRQKASEWNTVSGRRLKHAGLRRPLEKVKAGDEIFVHAEGYTNSLAVIGGPDGDPRLKPIDLHEALIEAGVKPGLVDLKIKILACFSGFVFTDAFYKIAHVTWPGVIVDGYKGKTRLAGQKMGIQAYLLTGGKQQIDTSLLSDDFDDEVALKNIRHRRGPEALG